MGKKIAASTKIMEKETKTVEIKIETIVEIKKVIEIQIIDIRKYTAQLSVSAEAKVEIAKAKQLIITKKAELKKTHKELKKAKKEVKKHTIIIKKAKKIVHLVHKAVPSTKKSFQKV